MKHAHFLLLLFFQTTLLSQNIKVHIPVQVNGFYRYHFLSGDKYIIGMPSGSGLLQNTAKYCIWNAKTGKYVHAFDRTSLSNFASTFSPDGKLFAVNPSAEKLYIGNTVSDVIIDSLPFHPSISLSSDVRFSPTGEFIVFKSSFSLGGINIYNIQNKTVTYIKGIFDMALTRFSKDGNYVCLISFGHKMEVIKLSDGKTFLTTALPAEVNQTNIYLQLAFSLEDSLIQIKDKKTLWLVDIFNAAGKKIDNVTEALAARKGYLVYIQDTLKKFRLKKYDLATKKDTLLSITTGDEVDITEAGDFIILKNDNITDKTYSIYNKVTNKFLWTVAHKYNGEIVKEFTFSPFAKYHVIQTYRAFHLFRTDGRGLIKSFKCNDQSYGKTSVFFSTDEKTVGIQDDVSVNVYNTSNGVKVAVLQNGGNLQNYSVTGFTPETHDINVDTYASGVVQINIDSVCVKPARKKPLMDDYTEDGKYFIRYNGYRSISVFDALNNKLIKNINLEVSGFYVKLFSKAKCFAEYDFLPNKMDMYDLKTGNMLWSKDLNGEGIPFFDANDKIFISETAESYNIYEVLTGKQLGKIETKGYLTTPIIDETSAYIYLINSNGKLKVFDVFAGMRVTNQVAVSSTIKDVHYTNFCDSFNCILVGDYGSGRFTDTFFRSVKTSNYSRGDYFIKESSDHQFLLAYYGTDDIEVWDIKHKKITSVIDVSSIQVKDLYISSDNRWIVVKGLQNELYLYDNILKKFVGTFYFFNDLEKQIAFVRNDGYYKIDKGVANYLRFRVNGILYDFDQLDLRYNRPDKILASFGNADIKLIDSYKSAYLKRISNMQIDTTQFTNDFEAPVVEVENEDELENQVESNKGVLKIHAFDKNTSNYLKRIFITVNGNPIYGSLGLNLESSQTRDTSLTVSINLSSGINIVKASCLNNRGVESFKSNINISYLPEKPIKPTVWFIGIGVSNYKDKFNHLNYSTKSVQQLDSLFSKKNKNTYTSILILDSMVTRENIKAVRGRLLREIKPDDKVIMIFSGHGRIVEKNGHRNFYYATFDMDFKTGWDEGISFEEIEGILDSVEAQNKIVLIDACNSGVLDRDGIGNASFELMQDLFLNTNRSNGATVMAASAGDKEAYEPISLGNSVFIHFILQGLKDGKADSNEDGEVTISELQNFVNKEIALYTDNRQKPSARIVNFDNDWVLYK
ncbi:MAG: caspase family protein [Ferruginibacter sp.]